MRLKALHELGVPDGKVYEWVNSSKRYWRIAGMLGACRHAHYYLAPSEGMDMPAGHLPKVFRSMAMGNRLLRNRTVGGVGGRRGDTPRLLSELSARLQVFEFSKFRLEESVVATS